MLFVEAASAYQDVYSGDEDDEDVKQRNAW